MLNSKKHQEIDRIGYAVAAGLLLLAFCLFSMTSCVTYGRFVRKFGHVGNDSATVVINDTVTIPKDSVILSLKTDTTTVHQVIQQGRAQIIYDRTKTVTRIQANCRDTTIIKEVPAKCPPVTSFGIAPWYKTAFYVTLFLLAVAVVAYIFIYQFQISITKRNANYPG